MNSFAEINAVDWTSLSHAYGDADDVPDMLRALRTDAGEGALDKLFNAVLHQGTIYTATIPAVRILAGIALDPSAAGRESALWFLAAYADSVADGWTMNPHYLPEGTDMVAFDASARAALAEAAAVVVPCLTATDAPTRAACAQFLGCVQPLPTGAVDALHAQLERESDDDATCAVAATLIARDRLTDTEQRRLADAPPKVRFAIAWAMFRAAAPGADIDTLASLWATHADAFASSGSCDHVVLDLVAARGTDATPLLDRLAASNSLAAAHGAILGYTALARRWRSGLPPALRGLVTLADRYAAGDAALMSIERTDNLDLRALLVYSLCELVPAVRPTDAAHARLCDALVAVANTAASPSPTPPPTTGPGNALRAQVGDVRADAAVGLLRARDPRWELLALAARAGAESVFPGAVAAARAWGRQGPLSNAVARALGDLPIDTAEAPAIHRAALRVATSGRDAWLDVIAALPDDVAREAVDAVVAALPTRTKAASLLLIRWRYEPAVKALRAVTDGRIAPNPTHFDATALAVGGMSATVTTRQQDESVWARAALGILTADADTLAAAFTPLPEVGESEALDLWAMLPSAALEETCTSLITDEVARSFPGRAAQATAAGVLLGRATDVAVLDRAWAALLAIINRAEQPLERALAIAVRCLDIPEPIAEQRREELTNVLRDIVVNGRESRSEPDVKSALVAARAVLRLQAGDPAEIAALALQAVHVAPTGYGAAKYGALACEVLAQSAADAGLTDTARKTLLSVLDTDERVRSWNEPDVIAEDEAFRAAATRALTALVG